jgi:molecular chaperone DnaJ
MNPQREWFEKDYYAMLGVSKESTDKEIKKAYRKLASDLHPDKNPGNDVAEEKFKDVSAAYDVLGDAAKRKEYNEVRAMAPMGQRGGGPGGIRFNVGDSGGLGDLFGNMFGGGNPGGGRGRGGSSAGVGPRRGANIEAQLTVDFEDAVVGLETSLYLTAEAQCSTCSGSGAKAGTSPKVCQSCGGRGVVDDNQGFFAMSAPCGMCSGNGVQIEFPCGTCHGVGIEKRPREVKARIPAGVKDGQTIRIKGRGAPGRNGGVAGDLHVQLRVMPHARFGRNGDNLTVTVPITFDQAALGADIDVPALQGGDVKLRIQPGTQSGSRHRVKDKGIERTAKSGKVLGHLIVTVDVVVPSELNDAQRSALEAFANASKVKAEGSS